MITAALEGKLDDVVYNRHPVFGGMMPASCPGVPPEMLNPEFTWKSKDAYYKTAYKLASYFIKNFEKYTSFVSKEILSASPKI